MKKAGAWGVFRYYDVQSILGDYTNLSSEPERKRLGNVLVESNPVARKSLLNSDPPYHRTLTGVIASVFTPKTIDKLETKRR
jgi:cytochrome P450